MTDRPQKQREPEQQQSDDALSLDKETLKDLDAKRGEDDVRGGAVRLSTIQISIVTSDC